MLRSFLFLFILLFSFSFESKANDKSFTDFLGVKFDAAAANYIITSEDIRRSGATSIPEALRLAPGVQVARIDANKWSITARGFGDQFSNKLLVLIDGRTVYTHIFSGVFWDMQDYILDDIDRIEVVRGPGGSIWGANAVNGIINIITKTSAKTQGKYGSAIIGNFDQGIFEARSGGKTEDDTFYRLYAKSRDNGSSKLLEGGNARDGYQQSQVGFRTDHHQSSKETVSFQGDVYRGRAKNYFYNFLSSTHRDDKESKGGNILTRWNKTISDKSFANLKIYANHDSSNLQTLDIKYTTYDIDFNNTIQTHNNNQFIWGAGYRYLKDKIEGESQLVYSPNEFEGNLYSAFLQNKTSFFDNKLSLTLGSKFEHNYYTGFEYQPNLRISYYPTDNQTFWSSISRSVRTPTRGERSLVILALSQSGGKNYGIEEIISYEAGYRIKPISSLLFDIAAFYNDYSNLRTFENINSRNVAHNLGYGEAYGIEMSTRIQVTNDWMLEFGYDFFKSELHVKNNSTDNLLTNIGISLESSEGRSPKNQLRLRSNYNITPKLEFDNIVYYVDSLHQDDIDPYIRLDLRFGYLLDEHWEFSLVGQNLTDDKHQEFKGGLYAKDSEIVRSYYFKINYRF